METSPWGPLGASQPGGFVPRSPGGNYKASEVPECQFCHIPLAVKVIKANPILRGGEIKFHLSMGGVAKNKQSSLTHFTDGETEVSQIFNTVPQWAAGR